jgi:hypothetical protein
MLRATGILRLKGCGRDDHHKIAKSLNDPMTRSPDGPIESAFLVNSGGGLYNSKDGV